jgi:hypothetical protein
MAGDGLSLTLLDEGRLRESEFLTARCVMLANITGRALAAFSSLLASGSTRLSGVDAYFLIWGFEVASFAVAKEQQYHLLATADFFRLERNASSDLNFRSVNA